MVAYCRWLRAFISTSSACRCLCSPHTSWLSASLKTCAATLVPPPPPTAHGVPSLLHRRQHAGSYKLLSLSSTATASPRSSPPPAPPCSSCRCKALQFHPQAFMTFCRPWLSCRRSAFCTWDLASACFNRRSLSAFEHPCANSSRPPPPSLVAASATISCSICPWLTLLDSPLFPAFIYMATPLEH